ncbi:MAG: Crp/Fnr family transcriptional regulator [Anaerolineales bacterium]|nr:Crp/Fnr family transcriptional regulator [Anaerolineales bacterium]
MSEVARILSAFDQLPHFADLPAEVKTAIAVAAIQRRLRAGQVIYVEGEPAEYVYLLAEGWVKATRITRQGREQAMMFLQAVDVFGDIAVFTGQPYPGTVVALEDVLLYAIPAHRILDLVARYPALALLVIRRMGARVLDYINLVEDLSLRSVEARLANTLLQHAELRAGHLVVPRRHWATFDEMAARLGTVRDVLSRTLRALEQEALLEVQRSEIIILDPQALAERGKL